MPVDGVAPQSAVITISFEFRVGREPQPSYFPGFSPMNGPPGARHFLFVNAVCCTLSVLSSSKGELLLPSPRLRSHPMPAFDPAQHHPCARGVRERPRRPSWHHVWRP